jgi:catechol 2,3-dioxygenase-like lactoylglutathione lyase family enzyme
MIGALDHVGYLTADLDAALEEFTAVLGLPVARHFERPEFSLLGVYLGPGEGNVELFTFSDPELLAARLGGQRIVLDHVAYAVDDIAAVAAQMRAAGVRFSGPDLRGELHEAVDLGGILHLWTVPESSAGAAIQLLQR